MIGFSQNGFNEFLIDALNLELRVLWGSIWYPIRMESGQNSQMSFCSPIVSEYERLQKTKTNRPEGFGND